MLLNHRFLLLTLIMGLLSGCASLERENIPTLLPDELIPTVIALTVEAGQATSPSPQPSPNPTASPTARPSATPTVRSATATPAPTPTLPPPTASPTQEEQPPPEEAALGAIQIRAPGPASRLTSPFQLHAFLNTGPAGKVTIELLGEDGRLLMREVKVFRQAANKSLLTGSEIKFEIPGVAEAARLQIGVEDEYGRSVSLASVDLILLSIGDADPNPVGDQLENILIEQPTSNALIQGGKVLVSGKARPRSDQPLMIELQTSDGRIVGTRQVAVQRLPGEVFGAFITDVPYLVSAPTRARLIVWERGERIPGMVHLSSLEVLLSP